MTKHLRLDAELVRRGLARSRTQARRAIAEGEVEVLGVPVTRPTARVSAEAPIARAAHPTRFVSRGGEKLDGALLRLGVTVAGRRWLDAGASTGGFTDRLLRGGATAVASVDVGYGQLDWALRNDDRVLVLERTNVRHLDPGALPWRADGVVADLSFISLRLVLGALTECAAPDDADFLLLVKPQFEVGRDSVGRGGVVRDRGLWSRALEDVVEAAGRVGVGLVDATAAAPPGPAGNREFFVHLRRDVKSDRGALHRAVEEVG